MLHLPAPSRSIRCWISLLAVFSIVVSGQHLPSASAQEIGIGVGGTQAGFGDALNRPVGLSGYLDIPVGQRFGARFMAMYHTEERSLTRSPCTGLARPGTDCTPEPFDADARFAMYGLGPILRLTAPDATVQPKVYLLFTFLSIDSSLSAQNSDRTLNPIGSESIDFGIALGGEVHYPITDIIALSAQIGIQRHAPGVCAEDGFDPFCETRTLVQGAVGMQFRIPGSIPE